MARRAEGVCEMRLGRPLCLDGYRRVFKRLYAGRGSVVDEIWSPSQFD